MSLINTKILPFKANAFRNGDFIEVSDSDINGKWAVFFFYPGDFTFVCPTELGDLADHYEELQAMGVGSRCPPIRTSCTKRGMPTPTPSAR